MIRPTSFYTKKSANHAHTLRLLNDKQKSFLFCLFRTQYSKLVQLSAVTPVADTNWSSSHQFTFVLVIIRGMCIYGVLFKHDALLVYKVFFHKPLLWYSSPLDIHTLCLNIRRMKCYIGLTLQLSWVKQNVTDTFQ